jgi:hypothetical protein
MVIPCLSPFFHTDTIGIKRSFFSVGVALIGWSPFADVGVCDQDLDVI